MSQRPILTLNSHEPWIYQLRHLQTPLVIADGLPGRYTNSWDLRMRPLPENGKLLPFSQAVAAGPFACVIVHSLSDLMAVSDVDAPKLLILHTTLEHRARQDGSAVDLQQFRTMFRDYVRWSGAEVLAGTALKAASFGLACGVAGLAVEETTNQFHGTLARGMRVANQINQKRATLYFDFHEEALKGLPVDLYGHNPEMPGVEPCGDFEELNQQFHAHRFYVHTAAPGLEDGFNMASVEAMAAGMPVLCNDHPTNIVRHGIDGFVAKTPAEMREFALRLLADCNLATSLGSSARARAVESFPVSAFVTTIRNAMANAQKRHRSRSIAGRRW